MKQFPGFKTDLTGFPNQDLELYFGVKPEIISRTNLFGSFKRFPSPEALLKRIELNLVSIVRKVRNADFSGISVSRDLEKSKTEREKQK